VNIITSKAKINVPGSSIAAFCRKHHINKLSLFGYVFSNRFGNESDVDVLVEFEPGSVASLIRMAGIEQEHSKILEEKPT